MDKNYGDIAEYIFAIAMGASFRVETLTETTYLELKNQFKQKYDPTNPQNILSISFESLHGRKSSIKIHLGKKGSAPTEQSKVNLKYFFEEISKDGKTTDPKIQTIERTAINYINTFKSENCTLWEKVKSPQSKEKQIEINSEGVIDQLQSKADITLLINKVKHTFSLKTTSKTVHSTGLGKEGIKNLFDTLFGMNLPDNIFPQITYNNDDLFELFQNIKTKVSSNGMISRKARFIIGLKQVITKKTNENFFKLVKLQDKNFSVMVFNKNYEKIAMLFDYMINVDSNPSKLRIKLKFGDKFNQQGIIDSNFVQTRSDGKKLLVDVGIALSLLADKYIEPFLKSMESDGERWWISAETLTKNPTYNKSFTAFKNVKLIKGTKKTNKDKKDVYYLENTGINFRNVVMQNVFK